ncbi:MAG: hypothetical protein A2V70_11310 [Planctomycetes bacterium RBG_13_63_9]|nr:MAG: hypothetical protein A2V70_11310 [Planctomycetes bacterium RBG_13_63_9]
MRKVLASLALLLCIAASTAFAQQADDRSANAADASAARQRERVVYHLRGAPAMDVANTIQEFLEQDRQLTPHAPSNNVVIVPDPITNSLLISAGPETLGDLNRLIESLDRRPKMVLIRVTIAEVTLGHAGQGDAADQGNASDQANAAGNPQDTTKAKRKRRTNKTEQESQIIGLPDESRFASGKLNKELRLSLLAGPTSSRKIERRIRALQKQNRAEIIRCPQLMTLDNQPAMLHIGQRIPRILGTSVSPRGQTNRVQMEDVGLCLSVTSRVTPDGSVTMVIDLQQSQLSESEEDVPVSVSPDGDVIRTPRVVTTTAKSTLAVADGQSVVLGGLITKSESRRTERWIIVTPRILGNDN